MLHCICVLRVHKDFCVSPLAYLTQGCILSQFFILKQNKLLCVYLIEFIYTDNGYNGHSIILMTGFTKQLEEVRYRGNTSNKMNETYCTSQGGCNQCRRKIWHNV